MICGACRFEKVTILLIFIRCCKAWHNGDVEEAMEAAAQAQAAYEEFIRHTAAGQMSKI